MKKRIILVLSVVCTLIINMNGQIDPLLSPYYGAGSYSVVMDSNMTTSPDILIFRPSVETGGPYPTVLFQPGANSGTAYINKHSYDLYWQHLASYGYVIIIMNNTAGGPNSSLFKNMHDWIKTQVNSGSGWMSEYIDLSRFIVSGHSNGGMNATDIIINRPNEIDAIVYMASYPNPGMFSIGAQNVSGYNGKVLLMCGDEDETSVVLVGTTNEVAEEAYDTRFTSASCKTWVFFEGIGHGGFGDYNNPAQPVGTIGRDKVTASIRHILVSFLNSQFKYEEVAFNNLNQSALQPNSVFEYKNTCGIVVEVASLSENDNFGLYPNPACDFVMLNGIEAETLIKIFDMQGNLLFERQIVNDGRIDISGYTSGIYLINISNQTRSFTKLFQKN